MLLWAIRKTTLSMLIQNIKTNSMNARTACTGWVQQEENSFNKAVMNLRETKIVRCLLFKKNGAIVSQPCLIQLWAAHGHEDIQKDIDATQIGITWQPLKTANNVDMKNIPRDFDPAERRFITVQDIQDIIFEPLSIEDSKWLYAHRISNLHHKQCKSQYFLISISTVNGHTLRILACCLHDFDNAILSLTDIVLFIRARKRLNAAGSSGESGKILENNVVKDALDISAC